MRHRDASVRLMSMEAWSHLVDVFRQSKEWIFKKSVVQLLMRPVLVCLDEERLLSILQAVFVAWRSVVSALVHNFKQFCVESVGSQQAIQENARKWKRWYDEAVVKPLAAVLKRRELSSNYVWEEGQFVEFATALWDHSVPEAPDTVSSSVASAALHVQETRDSRDLPFRDGSLWGEQPSNTSQDDAEPFGSNLFGLALILPEALGMIQRLVAHCEKHHDKGNERVSVVVEAVWTGLCKRLHNKDVARDQQSQKLRLRLLRIALEFAFAVPSGSVGSSEVATAGNDVGEQRNTRDGGELAGPHTPGSLFGIY